MKNFMWIFIVVAFFGCSTVSKSLTYDSSELKNRAVDNNKMGDLYLKNKQFDKTVSYYEKALKFYILSDNVSSIIHTYSSLCNAYNITKEFDKAIDMSDKAIKISKQENYNGVEVGFVYHFSGESYYHKGEYDKALKYYELSLEQLKGFSEYSAMVKISRAKLYLATEKKNQAENELLEAINILEKEYKNASLKRIDNLSGSYFQTAFYYFQQSQLDKSEMFIKKAIELDRLSENSSGLASDYYSLGRIYENKDIKKALYYYEKSRDLSIYLNFTSEFIQVTKHIASLYEKQADYMSMIKNLIYVYNIMEDSNLKIKFKSDINNIISSVLENNNLSIEQLKPLLESTQYFR